MRRSFAAASPSTSATATAHSTSPDSPFLYFPGTSSDRRGREMPCSFMLRFPRHTSRFAPTTATGYYEPGQMHHRDLRFSRSRVG